MDSTTVSGFSIPPNQHSTDEQYQLRQRGMDDWEEAEGPKFGWKKSRTMQIGRAPVPPAMVRAIEDSNRKAHLERANEDEA